MGDAAEQFREMAGLGNDKPDPALGLENAKETKATKDDPEFVVDREDQLHPTDTPANREDAGQRTTRGKRTTEAKATVKKKAAAKKTTAKK